MNPGLQDSTPVQLEPSPCPDTVPLGRDGGTQESKIIRIKNSLNFRNVIQEKDKQNWFQRSFSPYNIP